MQQSAYLLMPSIWYENFPLTLVEAFASGLPVIASCLGAMAALIEDGKTGLLFDPGSADDLAKKIVWAESNPQAMREMGKQARQEYESKYTSERNFVRLMEIYEEAIASRSLK
jgi:glycosyltransferase involved in cell wall biosynthesis